MQLSSRELKLNKVVEWTEDLRDEPLPGRQIGELVGKKHLAGEVEIIVNLDGIARYLGRKALQNKSKKSHDGFVSVRVVKPAKVVREERR